MLENAIPPPPPPLPLTPTLYTKITNPHLASTDEKYTESPFSRFCTRLLPVPLSWENNIHWSFLSLLREKVILIHVPVQEIFGIYYGP